MNAILTVGTFIEKTIPFPVIRPLVFENWETLKKILEREMEIGSFQDFRIFVVRECNASMIFGNSSTGQS